jgi:regulator of replication initiation timing
MSELEIIIEGLSDKVRKLGDRQRILVAENERLRSANEQLEVEISTQKKANHILDEQNKVAKIAKSVSPDTEGRKRSVKSSMN